jgi:hypothetical protein
VAEQPPCEHEDVDVFAEMQRLTKDDRPGAPVVGYSLEIGVGCHSCPERFVFHGLPLGLAASHPTGSLDGQTLIAPMRPASAPETFGLDVPGIAVNLVAPDLYPDSGWFGPPERRPASPPHTKP